MPPKKKKTAATKKKPSRLGTNNALDALDAVIPSAPAPAPKRPDTAAPPQRKVKRETFHVSVPLLERLHRAVIGLQARGELCTKTSFVEDALSAHIARVEKDFNKGQPFPASQRPLRIGRPLTGTA